MSKPFKESKNIEKIITCRMLRINFLEKTCNLKPSSLEIKYKLEQWRWLENGYKIHVLETVYDTFSVDTPEDLKKIIKKFGDSN